MGGYARSTFGSATAVGNSVTISGGNVTGDVWGGATRSDFGSATASNNSVTITGGDLSGALVYGGIARIETGSATAMATGNSVSISGAPTLTDSNLYGGFASGAGAALDVFSGNTLNVLNYSGSALASVRNFEHYNFVFPASQSGPVLEAGTAILGGGTRSSIVTANTLGGSSPLRAGNSVTLISGTISPNGFNQTNAEGLHGATLRYTWTLDASSGLTATLNGVEATPQAKALSESWLSGMALVNQGADAVAGLGMASAVQAVQNAGNAFAGFGSLSGGWSRYNTGSHMDVSGVSLLAGLAFGTDLTPGRLTLGAFFEHGTGSYDTHNSFSTAASVNGDGDIYYLGGGILARMDFANTGPDRRTWPYPYAETRASPVF